jgi:transposase-like protein
MIEERIVYHCEKCGSGNLTRNGHSPNRKQKSHCGDCDHYGRLNKAPRYSSEDRKQIVDATQERCSLRGIERVLSMRRATVS